ncbi:hypothetical protein D3C75_813420 [compost metagenome]
MLDLINGPGLVPRFLIREHAFKVLLVRCILAEPVPRPGLAVGIQLDQVVGNILDSGAGLGLDLVPIRAAQLVNLRLLALIRADVLLDQVNLFNGNGQLVAPGI